MHAKWDRRFLESQGWWALGALWLACVLWTFLNGPRLHAEATHQAMQETLAENQEACGRLNMSLGSAGFSTCVSTLDDVRRAQNARTEQLDGLL